MKRIAAEYVYTGVSDEPVRNGFVEFAEVGTVISVGETPEPGAEKDFRQGALTPGFVNSHCHLELSHLKGKFRRGSGMSGFINQINELRDFTSVENKKAEAAKWLDILWNSGVSAMADISNCDDTFRMKSQSPLYTRTFLEVFGTEPQDCPAIMEDVRKLAAEAASFGIDAAPTPHACYTMSPELVSAASAEALAAGWLSYHSEESREEEDLLVSGTGALAENYRGRHLSTPPVTGKPSLCYFIDRLLEVHGAPFDEHILLVHNVCLTQEALDYALGYLNNVWFAVCPLSNIFIHNALPPVGLMRENGLKITIGTDSLSSNDTLDMVAEMYCLAQAFPDVPLGEIIRWATYNGAEFLGKSGELGSLSPGLRPGIVWISDIAPDGALTSESSSVRII